METNSTLHENKLNLTKIKNIITNWAKRKDLIRSIYLYGSRIKGNYLPDSDLDIAIEVISSPEESTTLIWLDYGDIWGIELQELLSYQIDLQLLDEDSPTVQKGIDDSSLLVYTKKGT